MFVHLCKCLHIYVFVNIRFVNCSVSCIGPTCTFRLSFQRPFMIYNDVRFRFGRCDKYLDIRKYSSIRLYCIILMRIYNIHIFWYSFVTNSSLNPGAPDSSIKFYREAFMPLYIAHCRWRREDDDQQLHSFGHFVNK